jgi:Ca-activated chloride channel homolog
MTAVQRTLLALLLLDAASAAGQAPPFRAETRLVVLHATVTNARGELVTNLDQRAFSVEENGKRQPITLFRRDDVPISVGLLIDNSGSMRALRSKVEAAALAFARASNPHDELFVVNFADKVHLDVPMTADRRVLEAGIGRVDSIGGTALRDAVDMAERYLGDHATHDRRVLLVITDGKDNASVTSSERIRRQAEQSQTAIHAIGLVNEHDAAAGAGRHELTEMTGRTGGIVYFPANIDQVEAVAVDLAVQIRNQYTIAYAPLNQALDGSYRSIRVSVNGGDHYTVHTRTGYRAMPEPVVSHNSADDGSDTVITKRRGER